MRLRRDTRAITATLATVLLLAVVLALSVVVLGLAQYFSNHSPAPPRSFGFDSAISPTDATVTIRVVVVPVGADWSDLRVTGCTGVPTGPILPGAQIDGCSGEIRIVDERTNSLVYRATVD